MKLFTKKKKGLLKQLCISRCQNLTSQKFNRLTGTEDRSMVKQGHTWATEYTQPQV